MTAAPLHWIKDSDPPHAFPDISTARTDPDGLLAAGGNLTNERLLYAYQHGIFPWSSDELLVLWWSPDPRCVLVPAEFHLSRRLRRDLRSSNYQFSFNQAFADVIDACAADRDGQSGTWITSDMTRAYCSLHDDGWAHSVEIWHEDELVGGLYGLVIGRLFFGESMFSRVPNASKIAMCALSRLLLKQGFSLLDCQVESPHLLTLGAKTISRHDFQDILHSACHPPSRFEEWPGERSSVGDLV